MNMFKSPPSVPTPSPKPIPVNQDQSIRAKDEAMARLARIRAANVRTSQLTTPSVRRRELGAGRVTT